MCKTLAKGKSILALGILSVISLSALSASGTQSNLVVTVIIPGDGGIYIGFEPQPSVCYGHFKKTHTFLSKNAENFDATYAYLSTAKATRKPVRITYVGAGGCTSSDSVLTLTSIE